MRKRFGMAHNTRPRHNCPFTKSAYGFGCRGLIYAFAHRPAAKRAETLSKLKRLLVEQGVLSPGWDPSQNVEQAIQATHADASWLLKLAEVVTEILNLRSWIVGPLGQRPNCGA